MPDLTLTDFLDARIGEDEARAYEFHNQLDCDPSFTCTCGYPERIAAECEAKRQLIGCYAEHQEVCDHQPWAAFGGTCQCGSIAHVLLAFAVAHADHPDYRENFHA